MLGGRDWGVLMCGVTGLIYGEVMRGKTGEEMSTLNQDPETNTEEALEIISLLYGFFDGNYKAVDNWMFSSNPYMNGRIPWELIQEGAGIEVLNFVQEKLARNTGLM